MSLIRKIAVAVAMPKLIRYTSGTLALSVQASPPLPAPIAEAGEVTVQLDLGHVAGPDVLETWTAAG